MSDSVRLCLDHGDRDRFPVFRKDTCHAALAANKTHRHLQNSALTTIGQRLNTQNLFHRPDYDWPGLSWACFHATSRDYQTRERASHRRELHVLCALGLTLHPTRESTRPGSSGICRVAFDFPATYAFKRHTAMLGDAFSEYGRLPARPNSASPQL